MHVHVHVHVIHACVVYEIVNLACGVIHIQFGTTSCRKKKRKKREREGEREREREREREGGGGGERGGENRVDQLSGTSYTPSHFSLPVKKRRHLKVCCHQPPQEQRYDFFCL